MKIYAASVVLALCGAFAQAAAPQRQYIISYPEDTPTSVLEQAKEAVLEAGGMITHEFNLIKAFAVNAPEKIIESIQAMGSSSNVLIEEDKEVKVASS